MVGMEEEEEVMMGVGAEAMMGVEEAVMEVCISFP